MSTTRSKFQVRPAHVWGVWLTDVTRHHSWSRARLTELKSLHAQIEQEWPGPLDADMSRDELSPSLWQRSIDRAFLADSIVVFSAMAVEGFLNFYGVVRLGESEYLAHFERLGLVPKLRQLVLICDGLSITTNDPLVKTLASLAERRNQLVHPKAREMPATGSVPDHWKRHVVEYPASAVSEMNTFFQEFARMLPASRELLPRGYDEDA